MSEEDIMSCLENSGDSDDQNILKLEEQLLDLQCSEAKTSKRVVGALEEVKEDTEENYDDFSFLEEQCVDFISGTSSLRPSMVSKEHS